MNPQHVTSLEISKQLKEAGWTKNTEFWWCQGEKETILCHTSYIICITGWYVDRNCEGEENPIREKLHSAPLATELLEELPAKISDKTWLAYFKSENGYGGVGEKIGYYEWERHPDGSVIHKKIIEFSACCKDPIEKVQYFSLPGALAKLWIYLQKEV